MKSQEEETFRHKTVSNRKITMVHTTPYNTIQLYFVIYFTVLHYTVLYCTVLHRTTLDHSIEYSALRYYSLSHFSIYKNMSRTVQYLVPSMMTATALPSAPVLTTLTRTE